MSEGLTTYQSAGQLSTIEDLSHFLLIAPEKASAMRAEIRAIQKVGLAKAVYDQKLEEQRRLCDMILDASVRLGEMTKAIPKAPADRKSESYQKQRDSGVPLMQTKEETINDLGFSKKQVQRFETLADNRDLVEQEKAQAREEGRMPTRSNVLSLAQERQRRLDEEKRQAAEDYQTVKRFNAAIRAVSELPDTEEVLQSLIRQYRESTALESALNGLRDGINKMLELERILGGEVRRRG